MTKSCWSPQKAGHPPIRYGGVLKQILAEKAGLSFNAITKIEQGAAEHPTLKTLLKLADAFGISLDALVGRK